MVLPQSCPEVSSSHAELNYSSTELMNRTELFQELKHQLKGFRCVEELLVSVSDS